jgi:small-conductance mechanosensitive channel
MTMTNVRKEAEQLKQHEEVKEALRQIQPPTAAAKGVSKTKGQTRLGLFSVLLVAFAILYYAVGLQQLRIPLQFVPALKRVGLAGILVCAILIVHKLIDLYLVSRISHPVSRYNVRRIIKLIVGLLLFFVAITSLFANWYTAVVSLGLISLILGFALQTPITSFIGWIYILVKTPYRVGDRIKMGSATGDVIEVDYLDTTLWEFGGDYLSTDHPSGRLIKIPNSHVLSAPVYNYSWPLFPYIWNEIKFQIAYQADLNFIATTMQEVAEKELGDEMMQRVNIFRELLAQTPVDHLDVREKPTVMFRVTENSWLEVIIRYLVPPKEAGRIKTRLLKQMLDALKTAPDRVLFPAGNSR